MVFMLTCAPSVKLCPVKRLICASKCDRMNISSNFCRSTDWSAHEISKRQLSNYQSQCFKCSWNYNILLKVDDNHQFGFSSTDFGYIFQFLIVCQFCSWISFILLRNLLFVRCVAKLKHLLCKIKRINFCNFSQYFSSILSDSSSNLIFLGILK